ncbi:MAG: hypothetical protein SGJ19_19640, partial [Planctomycetia bacterium]|nr:hypothetical protein [Planctomycetia bacterium]
DQRFLRHHHGVAEIAVLEKISFPTKSSRGVNGYDGDTLQSVRGDVHYMPVIRQVALGDFQKHLISVSN